MSGLAWVSILNFGVSFGQFLILSKLKSGYLITRSASAEWSLGTLTALDSWTLKAWPGRGWPGCCRNLTCALSSAGGLNWGACASVGVLSVHVKERRNADFC